MNPNWLLIAVFAIGLAALIGFFVTKTKGFGRFATSTLLLLLVLVLSCLFYAGDKMNASMLSNLLFAIIGFAGGLFAPKEKPKDENRVPTK
jgi:hypothetical protein